METVLLIITLISAATAGVALASVWRVRRREQERSDARVAALSEAADADSGEGGWTRVDGEWQWTTGAAATAGVGAGIRGDRAANPRASAGVPDSSAGLPADRFFGTVQREEPGAGRLPLAAAAALIVLLGGALVYLNTSESTEAAATAARVSPIAPLELVALKHSRGVGALTISGAVRNPSSGVKLEGLTAVVTLLEGSGALVSTKDVPLDYRALGPGEEAPFTVTIPNPGSIGRYRVSFRAGPDVVPHVDRRNETTLASAGQ